MVEPRGFFWPGYWRVYTPLGVWGLGLVHYEVILVWELSSRLDTVVRGKFLDARPVGTGPEFVEDTLRCNCLWLGG